ncbi:flavin reductase family protein [Rhodococcus rhodochrous]|uniref:Flavin oxidoreductase n=1 Tax=Rhodococcus rhodochrous KG-21 TaxID=1441923 RepID=A0A0M9WP63_RHORH|nr:flavin reductase family protein [Rhodococcus rhodochrous]KOS56373.1 flavin oxidoreductase [Rhodococcus rhodochrous KG-21]
MTDIATPADRGLFREVMGHYPTGVAVVTGRADDGELLALVVGTFGSVSLDPPLVSFMPMKTSRTFAKLRECASLCINIVGGEQEELVSTLARRWENKFDGIDWFPSPSGDPVLADSVAWIDTRITDTVEAGDHWIVLCAVADMAVTNPVAPLIFFQGGYGSFVGTSLLARLEHRLLSEIQEADCARTAVEDLAHDIGCEVTVYTAVGRDEMATVLSASAPGIDPESGLAQRVPIVPPIGDSLVFDLPPEDQERWLAKARGVEEPGRQLYRDRLDFVRAHGFLLSFLPREGGAAYEGMRDATHRYANGRLTPAQERNIRERVVESAVDYTLRDLEEEETYDIGSVVLPVRDRAGGYTRTLRLGQLPRRVSGTRVREWIARAQEIVDILERGAGSDR